MLPSSLQPRLGDSGSYGQSGLTQERGNCRFDKGHEVTWGLWPVLLRRAHTGVSVAVPFGTKPESRSQPAGTRVPTNRAAHRGRRLTERVRSKGAGRRLRLFGLQVGQAGGRGVRGEAVHGRFACRRVQRQVRRGRRGLHEQGLGQLALLLLDLLLQVSDCARDLVADVRT